MAADRDIVKIISIEAQPALKTLKDLKKEVEDAAIALAKMTEGTAEYEEAAADLTKKQEQLNKAVGLAKNANQPAADSYAALQKQMTALRKEWRETGDAMKRNELGKQINGINDRLKMMDKSIGVFNRNVGNYSGSVIEAFRTMGGTAGGALTTGVTTANNAFKLLSANPVVGTLTLLVAVISKIVGALKSSEDNANAASLAFSSFKVVGDLVTNALQGLGKAVAWVGTQFNRLLDALNIETEKRRERMQIAENEIAITKKERENQVENAKLSFEVSELRAKANERLTYSDAQRAKFLEEADAKEKQIAQNELDLAQLRYETAKREAALTQNSKEANDELARAEAELYRVKESYNQRTYRLQSQLNSALKADAAAAAKSVGETEEQAFAKRLEALDDFNDSWEKKERDRHAKELELTKKAFEELQIETPKGLQPVIDAANKAYGEDVFNKRMATEAKERLEEAAFNAAKAGVDGLADLLEASGEENEKAVNAAKGLRAASATMDALAAANAAYQSLAGIPVVGVGLGIAAAAAALASGYANVRQILAVNTKGTTSVSSATSNLAASGVQAPAVVREAAAQRTLTTNTQEQTLNKIATDTRVYVVESDIQQAGKKVAVRQGEATFS